MLRKKLYKDSSFRFTESKITEATLVNLYTEYYRDVVSKFEKDTWIGKVQKSFAANDQSIVLPYDEWKRICFEAYDHAISFNDKTVYKLKN